MLRPLIERLLRPVRNPRDRTAVLLDRGDAWITGVEAGSDGMRLVRSRRLSLSHNPFMEEAGNGAIAAAAIAEFLRVADGGRYNSLRIALPDPAINLSVFELDAIPKTRRERDELVRWLFKKELYLDTDNLACISQDLGTSGGGKLLLGAAADSAWINGIRRALQDAGIFPGFLGASAVAIFNALPETGSIGRNAAALVSFENDFWSLLLWDESLRPRFMRGYWRESAGSTASDAELRGIASEAEHLITSYAKTSAEHRIDKIYVAGGGVEVRRFVGLLNGRLSEDAQYLDFSGHCRDSAADIPACCYALCADA